MSITGLPPSNPETPGDEPGIVASAATDFNGVAPLPVRRATGATTIREPIAPSAEEQVAPSPTTHRAEAAEPKPVASAWQRRALWLGLVAFTLAGVGEYQLFSDDTRGIGVALLLLGVLAGIIAWNGARSEPWPSSTSTFLPGSRWWWIAWRRSLVLRLLGIGVAIVFSIGSIAAYFKNPDDIFGAQGWLWLDSMGVLLFSCARWYPREGRPATGQGRSTIARDPEGTPLIEERPMTDSEVAGRLPASRFTPSSFVLRPSWSVAAFASIIALSLVTHLAFLEQIPWRFHFDEGFAYIEVMRFYRGPAISLFTTTWVNTSLPSMWFGISGLLMHITGPTLAGVRLSVALAGALTVIPVYGLGRLLAGTRGALLAAFAVAVSAVYVHYSRVSIINVTTPLFWATCFYFLLKGLRSRRPGDFVMSGLAAGLSMYTYYGTRLLPYLLAAFLAYLMIFHFKASRERLGHFALAVIGFVVGFGPLIGYFIHDPQMWAGRGISQLNVPAGIPTSWDAISSDWNIIAPLLWRNFLGLATIPGRDTVYYAPFLLPLEAALLVLGLGVLVWRWRQPASFLVLLWVMGVILTGGVLLDAESIPSFAHWTPAFPAFFLALVLPLALVWNALIKLPRRAVRVGGSVLIALLMLADLGANAYAYLVQYPPKVPPDHSLETAQGRYIESVLPNTHVRSVGNTWVWGELFPTVDEMMPSPGTHLTRFFNPSRELPTVGEPGQNLAFIFYNDMWDYVPVLQSYYPGGTTGEVRSPDGTQIAQTYFVPAPIAANRYGVQATFSSPGGSDTPQWRGQVDTIGAVPATMQLSYPLTATWSGSFYVGEPGAPNVYAGPVKLTVQGVDQADLWVQGEQDRPNTPLLVEPGWVRFSMSAHLDGPGPVKVLLQQNDAAYVEIDRTRLWPTSLDQGLAATINGSATVHRVDPFIGAGFAEVMRGPDPGLDPDSLMLTSARGGSNQIRWEGEVNTVDGLYTMEIRSDAAFALTIDGTSVLAMCAAPQGNQVGDGQIQLSAGWHHVQIDYRLGGLTNRLEWFWVRPDGVREIVPPAALRIAPGVSAARPITWPVLPTTGLCR